MSASIPQELMLNLPREIKVVKSDEQHAIVPDRKAQLLRRIELMETEMGRMIKLLNELRADVLHLTIE